MSAARCSAEGGAAALVQFENTAAQGAHVVAILDEHRLDLLARFRDGDPRRRILDGIAQGLPISFAPRPAWAVHSLRKPGTSGLRCPFTNHARQEGMGGANAAPALAAALSGCWPCQSLSSSAPDTAPRHAGRFCETAVRHTTQTQSGAHSLTGAGCLRSVVQFLIRCFSAQSADGALP